MSYRIFSVLCFAFVLCSQTTYSQLFFTDPVVVESNASAERLITGDFDGNGYNDIAIKAVDGRIYIKYYFANQTFIESSFSAVFSPASAVNPTATADFNKDGKTDIAIFDNTAQDKVVVFTSIGNSFSKKAINVGGALSKQILTADYNSDGNPDILFISDGDNNIRLLTGDGAGNFALSTISNLSAGRGFVVNDFNKDGRNDFAVITYDKSVKTFIAQSAGGYVSNTYSLSNETSEIIAADFSNDNFADIVVSQYNSNTLSYFTNTGAGLFTVSPIAISSTAWNGLDYADYNNDGRSDIVVGTVQNPGITVLTNLGGSFSQSSITPNSEGVLDVAFVDLEKDGAVEMVATSYSRRLVIYKNSGSSYNQFKSFILAPMPIDGLLKDLDKDGNVDIISANPIQHTVSLHYGDGNSSFQKADYLEVGEEVYYVETGDFNGDNFEDIVYATQGAVFLIVRNGPRTYATAKFIGNGSRPSVGDVNGDSKKDIVTDQGIYLGDNATNFQYKSFSIAQSVEIKSADLNGDNKLDIVSFFGDQITLGRNDGAGNFTISQITGTKAIITIIIADVNNDQKNDILTGNVDGGATIFINTGNLQFSETIISVASGYQASVAAADFNKDGLMDIAIGDQAQKISFYEQKAGFTFNPPVTFGVTNMSNNAIPVADFNNDGFPDLVSLSLNGDPILLFKSDYANKPTIASSSMTFSDIKSQSAKVSLVKGNGSGRILVIKEDVAGSAVPVDNFFYSTNNGYGLGTELTTKSYALAQGDSSTFTIKNLKSNTTYFVSAFEYNLNGKKTSIKYLSPPVIASFKTEKDPVTGVGDSDSNIILYPNPSKEFILIQGVDASLNEVTIIDMRGLSQKSLVIHQGGDAQIDIQHLATGLYILTFSSSKGEVKQKFIKK